MEEIQSDVSLATLHASAIANALHALEATTVVNLDEQTTVAGQAQAKSVIANQATAVEAIKRQVVAMMGHIHSIASDFEALDNLHSNQIKDTLY